MPIVGNLSEFPLPEVLILIGQRTGRLRLLDIPEFGILDMDIAEGDVQAVRNGSELPVEPQALIDKLGAIIQTQSGMFEFRHIPVTPRPLEESLNIHDLAMKLIYHVDVLVEQQRLALAGGHYYRMVDPLPPIRVEPALHAFLDSAYELLLGGATLEAIARHFEMVPSCAHHYLQQLWQMGLVEVIRMEDSEAAESVPDKTEAPVDHTRLFRQPEEMPRELQRISSGLP